MEKTLAWISSTGLMYVLSALVLALLTHVSIDIIDLFEVESLQSLEYHELFGLFLVIRLVLNRPPTIRELRRAMKDEDEFSNLSATRAVGYSILMSVVWSLMILGGWLTAYVVFWWFI